MPPIQVNDHNRAKVFKNLYPKIKDNRKPRLNKGDQVRLLKEKSVFEKGYTRSWSKEIYNIRESFSDSGADYYSIADIEGNILPRKKYYWELNLVSRNAD